MTMEEQEAQQVKIKLDEGKKLTDQAEIKVQKKSKSYAQAIEKQNEIKEIQANLTK